MASKTIIEELVSKLGFEIDTKNLDQFNQKSEKIKQTLKRVGIVAFAAGSAIVAYASKLAIATDAQVKFAKSIGETHDTIQELRFAAEREGASLQSLQSSLLALSQRISEVSLGQGAGVEVLGMLNIDVLDKVNGRLKTASELMEDIAASSRFQALGPSRQRDFAGRLGISTDMLLLLQKGRTHIRALRQEAREMGLVTAETAKRSEEWQDALAATRFMIRTITTNITGELLPTLIDLNKRFTKWFATNKDLIKQKLEKVIKGVADTIQFLAKHMKVLLALMAGIVALKFGIFLAQVAGAAKLLGLAVTALNVKLGITNALMFAVPAAIIAAIAAVALLAQDFAVFLRGGDSLTGRLIDGLAKIGVAMVDAFLSPIERAIEAFLRFKELVTGAPIRSMTPQTIRDQMRNFDRNQSLAPVINIQPRFDVTGSTGDIINNLHRIVDTEVKVILEQSIKNTDNDNQ